MNCATCGRENSSHLTFCDECGQKLPPPVAPKPMPALPPAVRLDKSAPTAEAACRVCATPNGANLRYCTSCGSTLVLAVAPHAPPALPLELSSAPNAAAVAPSRVIDVVRALHDPIEAIRTCGRCSGVVEGRAHFCKFCGGPLALVEGLARAPTTRPPLLPVPAPPASVVRPSAGPPPPPSRHTHVRTPARLVVIAKSGADGPSYRLADTLDIGRCEGDIKVGEDPYLSPRHVRVVWAGSKLILRDLASTNGVYLRIAASRDKDSKSPRADLPANVQNGPEEVAVPLNDQDLILVGQQVLRFESVKSGDVGFGPATEHGTLLFGSPASPRYARLSQRTVEGVTRDVYYVRKVETVLGRESGDVVFTEDPFLSRRHAAIRVLGAGAGRLPSSAAPECAFELVDLASSNGTFLRIRRDTELAHQDQFRVGQQLFRVDFDSRELLGNAS